MTEPLASPSDWWLAGRALLALLIVTGLILALGRLAERYKWHLLLRAPGSKTRQLALLETLPLDAKRRLVLVRAGEREYLLLCSPGQDVLLSQHEVRI